MTRNPRSRTDHATVGAPSQVRRSRRMRVVALLASLALVWVPGQALAAPSPNTGPTAGGTVVDVGVLPTFTDIDAGDLLTIAIGTDGYAYTWGLDFRGQLGNGAPTADSDVPVRVDLPVAAIPVAAVSTLGAFAVAIGANGEVYAWGYNTSLQLAQPVATTESPSPMLVSVPAAAVPVQSIEAGGRHVLIIGADGNVYSWGENGNGELGTGTHPADSGTPSLVSLPAAALPVTQVAAGSAHSLALGADAKVYAWGSNVEGQLGDATFTDRDTPGEVADLPTTTPVAQIAVGAWNSFAVGTNGVLYSWGSDLEGALGNDLAVVAQSSPVLVDLPASVTSVLHVTANDRYAIAIGNDGNTYSWGRDGEDALGDAASGNQHTPILVDVPAGAAPFSTVTAGLTHVVAIGADSRLYGWGIEDSGELGVPGDQSSPVPLAIPFDAAVTAVTFDGVPGTGLAFTAGTDTWSVVTPPHAAGPVDIVVSFDRFGFTNSMTFAGGFTYEAGLADTGVDSTPVLGAAVTLTLLGLGFAAWRRALSQG